MTELRKENEMKDMVKTVQVSAGIAICPFCGAKVKVNSKYDEPCCHYVDTDGVAATFQEGWWVQG